MSPVRTHEYDVTVTWTGNRGTGTSSYQDYDRAHDVTAAGPVNFPVLHEPEITVQAG